MDYKKEDQQSDNNSEDLPESQAAGTIGKLDFGTWTLISVIGIAFCFIHSEQERIWTWSGDTAEEAQSLQAKVIVSIISTIIGGCVVAILMKTIICVSFTVIKYKGAHFSQLVTLIGGYSPSNIPMLITGRGWFSISFILFALAVSAVTKQLAQVSMGVTQSWIAGTESFYTRNYTTCTSVSDMSSLQFISNSLAFDVMNSVRNPNSSYTNDLYDRSIPAGIKGEAIFNRELPFAKVLCISVPEEPGFAYIRPSVNTSKINESLSKAWATVVTVPLYRGVPEKELEWVSCTISVGHATVNTTCNETTCNSQRISEITPYPILINSPNIGVPGILSELFSITTPPSSGSRNTVLTWILGGDATNAFSYADKGVPGESLAVVQDRMELLGTTVGRILCDYNGGEPYREVTTFDSHYKNYGKYVYHILWKWPFWLLAGFIFICWIVCLVSMKITPESRIMSVEWLLGQYIERNRLCYLSGSDLVKAHDGSVFRVIDENPEGVVGNIAISKIEVQSNSKNDRILPEKLYM